MAEKYAVITGASSGIGYEFAKRLSKEGYSLILVARRMDRLSSLSAQLENEGTHCDLVTADLSQLSGCDKVIESLASKNICVFINNAGFGDCGNFHETDMSKDLSMIDVNIRALHYLTKEVLKIMVTQDHGHILNVGSSAGLLPAGPYMATYYATKAYVTSLTRAIATELKEKHSNVHISVLCPGPVDTEFNSVANVKFGLAGITADYCANYAIDQMKKKKLVIIPSLKMKLAIILGRHLPQSLLITLAGHQQKKKIYR